MFRANIEAERGRLQMTKTDMCNFLGITLKTYNGYIRGTMIPSTVWIMGKAIMKDWKAAVRMSETWERWQTSGGKSDVKTASDYEGGESFV